MSAPKAKTVDGFPLLYPRPYFNGPLLWFSDLTPDELLLRRKASLLFRPLNRKKP